MHVYKNVSPRPYTWGMCGTCSAAKSGIERTTVFSADPLYTPGKRKGKGLKHSWRTFENATSFQALVDMTGKGAVASVLHKIKDWVENTT